MVELVAEEKIVVVVTVAQTVAAVAVEIAVAEAQTVAAVAVEIAVDEAQIVAVGVENLVEILELPLIHDCESKLSRCKLK